MKKLIVILLSAFTFYACSFSHRVDGQIIHKVEIDAEALSDLFVAICKDSADSSLCMTEMNQLFWSRIVVGEQE